MRKTKIIGTVGPACDNDDILRHLIAEGMNVCRLNFSHGTHEEHKERIERIKRIREELNAPVPIMLDTKGPEYRIGEFDGRKVTLEDGQKFTFTTDDILGDNTRVSVSYKNLIHDLSVGDTILVNNGLVVCKVDELTETEAICTVECGGVLSNKKSMNFPNHVMTNDFLSDNDKSDLLFGIENDVDFIAASFVSTKDDIQAMRNFLDQNGGKDIEIIAKIENRAGVDNVSAICDVADGIMVARGDLGVEIPFAEVPSIQKLLMSKCRKLGKRVIVATEMLESMITNPRPTRAEISDVANAVYDGASAVMLSGETAAGQHPVEAVRVMAQACENTEEHIDFNKTFNRTGFKIRGTMDALSHAACQMAVDVNAKALVVSSMSGQTARMVSRFRCPIPIIGRTTDKKVWRKLNLSWGVFPMLSKNYESVEVMFYEAMEQTVIALDLKEGDTVVLTGGSVNGRAGTSNTIKVLTVQ